MGGQENTPEPCSNQTESNGDPNRKWVVILVVYNVFIALSTIALIVSLLGGWRPWHDPSNIITILLLVVIAGTCGGTLCNLRGIFEHVSINEGQFPKRLEVPFYIRPVTGALTGLFTFFVGNLLLPSSSTDASTGNWEQLPDQLPYIGVALLAGFAAQQFMERLKETAKTLFSEREEPGLDEQLQRLWELYQSEALNEEEFKRAKDGLFQ